MSVLTRFKAAQLRKPFGIYGRRFLPKYLDRLNAQVNEHTLASLGLGPDDRVIEVGFGSGDLIDRMTSVVTRGRIVGVDYSSEMVYVCTKRFSQLIDQGMIQLRCADAESLPYESDSFARACTVNTIYFWQDPSIALGELHRVLKADGRLVVSFSPRARLQDPPVTRHGFNLYDPEQVRDLLEDVGFIDVELRPGVGPRGEFMSAIATKDRQTRQ